MKNIIMLLVLVSIIASSCQVEDTQKGLQFSPGSESAKAIQRIDTLITNDEAKAIKQANGLDQVSEAEAKVYSKANFFMLMSMKRDFEQFKKQVETGTVPLSDTDSLSIMIKKAELDGYVLTKRK